MTPALPPEPPLRETAADPSEESRPFPHFCPPQSDKAGVDVRPEVSQQATVCCADGTTFDAVVEGAPKDRLVLRLDADQPIPDTGSAGELRWGSPTSGFHCPITFLTGTAAPEFTLWVVQPSGPASRRQNRSFVRVSTGTALKVQLEDGEPTMCTLLDVSEEALRGQIPAATAWEMPIGSTIRAWFNLGEVAYELPGTVIRIMPGRRRRWAEFVVRFEHPEAERRRLRRSVFAEQVRQHNLLAEIRV